MSAIGGAPACAASYKEGVMRSLVMAALAVVLTAAPSMAQTERGYLSATGGFVKSPDGTSGDMLGEIGVRVAPHVLLFGDLGRFHNLQPSDVRLAVDQTTTTLQSADGLIVIGEARVPAWHSI